MLSTEAREKYGLSDESAVYIKDVIEKYSDKAIVNVLKWDHEELAIMKLYSTHHSIHANHDGKQYFVYTPKIAFIRNKEIARKIYREFIEWTSISLTPDTLTEMFQRKTDINFYNTVHTLAPNLPVYELKHSLSGSVRYFKKVADKSMDLWA